MLLRWLFLPLFAASAEFLEHSSKAAHLFNFSTPYDRPHILKLNASAAIELRLSSCQFNEGVLLSSSADAELTLFPHDLLRILTDTSKGCPTDPFYEKPTGNVTLHLTVTTKETAANYSIAWLNASRFEQFDVKSSRHHSRAITVDLRKGVYVHATLALNSSIEFSVAGCVQQQGLPLFNLSSPSANSLNLTSSALVELVEKILCPGDSLLYHGDKINLYFIIKSYTPASSGLLYFGPSVDDDHRISRDGPRLKRNIDACFTLEAQSIQYSHIDPIETEKEEDIQLDVHVKSGRMRVSIMGCDDSPPLSLGEFIPGTHSLIMNSLIDQAHCNYTVKTGIPITLEGILKSEGHIKLKTKESPMSGFLTLEYAIIAVLACLLIFACIYNLCFRLKMRKRALGRITEKKPPISVIETSWH